MYHVTLNKCVCTKMCLKGWFSLDGFGVISGIWRQRNRLPQTRALFSSLVVDTQDWGTVWFLRLTYSVELDSAYYVYDFRFLPRLRLHDTGPVYDRLKHLTGQCCSHVTVLAQYFGSVHFKPTNQLNFKLWEWFYSLLMSENSDAQGLPWLLRASLLTP